MDQAACPQPHSDFSNEVRQAETIWSPALPRPSHSKAANITGSLKPLRLGESQEGTGSKKGSAGACLPKNWGSHAMSTRKKEKGLVIRSELERSQISKQQGAH